MAGGILFALMLCCIAYQCDAGRKAWCYNTASAGPWWPENGAMIDIPLSTRNKTCSFKEHPIRTNQTQLQWQREIASSRYNACRELFCLGTIDNFTVPIERIGTLSVTPVQANVFQLCLMGMYLLTGFNPLFGWMLVLNGASSVLVQTDAAALGNPVGERGLNHKFQQAPGTSAPIPSPTIGSTTSTATAKHHECGHCDWQNWFWTIPSQEQFYLESTTISAYRGIAKQLSGVDDYCRCVPMGQVCKEAVTAKEALHGLARCVLASNSELFSGLVHEYLRVESDAMQSYSAAHLTPAEYESLSELGFTKVQMHDTRFEAVIKVCGQNGFVALADLSWAGAPLERVALDYWTRCPYIGNRNNDWQVTCLIYGDCSKVGKTRLISLRGVVSDVHNNIVTVATCTQDKQYNFGYGQLACKEGYQRENVEVDHPMIDVAPVGDRWHIIKPGHYNLAISPAVPRGIQVLIAEDIEQLNRWFSNCVSILELPWMSEVDIIVDWNTQGRCYGTYGHKDGDLSEIQLAQGCWEKNITFIHEVFHVFGRKHEQTRQDADKYITVNWQYVPKNLRLQFEADPQPTAADNFPYDLNSVMHYGLGSWMTAKNGAIQNRTGPTFLDIWSTRSMIGCMSAFQCSTCKTLMRYTETDDDIIEKSVAVNNNPVVVDVSTTMQGDQEYARSLPRHGPTGLVIENMILDHKKHTFWQGVGDQNCDLFSPLPGKTLPESIFGRAPDIRSTFVCDNRCKKGTCEGFATELTKSGCVKFQPDLFNSWQMIAFVEQKGKMSAWVKTFTGVIMVPQDTKCHIGFQLTSDSFIIGAQSIGINRTKSCAHWVHDTKFDVERSWIFLGKFVHQISDYKCVNERNKTVKTVNDWHRDCFDMKDSVQCRGSIMLPQYSIWTGLWYWVVRIFVVAAVSCINWIAGIITAIGFILGGVFALNPDTHCVPHIPEIVGSTNVNGEWINGSIGFTMITPGQCIRFRGENGTVAELVFNDAFSDMALRPIGGIPTTLRSDVRVNYRCRMGNTDISARSVYDVEDCAFVHIRQEPRYSVGVSDQKIPCFWFGDTMVGFAFVLPCSIKAGEYAYIFERSTVATAPVVHWGFSGMHGKHLTGTHDFAANGKLTIRGDNETLEIDFIRSQEHDIRKLVNYAGEWYHCSTYLDNRAINPRPSANTSWLSDEILDLEWHFSGKTSASVTHRQNLFEEMQLPYCQTISAAKMSPWVRLNITGNGFNKTAEGKVAPIYMSASIVYSAHQRLIKPEEKCTADLRINQVHSSSGTGYTITTVIIDVGNSTGDGSVTFSATQCSLMGPSIFALENREYELTMRCGFKKAGHLIVTICGNETRIPFEATLIDWTWDITWTYHKVSETLTFGGWDKAVSWFQGAGETISHGFKSFTDLFGGFAKMISYLWTYLIPALMLVLGLVLIINGLYTFGAIVTAIAAIDFIWSMADAAVYDNCEGYEWMILVKTIVFVMICNAWIRRGWAIAVYITLWVIDFILYEDVVFHCYTVTVGNAITDPHSNFGGWYAIAMIVAAGFYYYFDGNVLIRHILWRLDVYFTRIMFERENIWDWIISGNVTSMRFVNMVQFLFGLTSQIFAIFTTSVLLACFAHGALQCVGFGVISFIITWYLCRPRRQMERRALMEQMMENEDSLVRDHVLYEPVYSVWCNAGTWTKVSYKKQWQQDCLAKKGDYHYEVEWCGNSFITYTTNKRTGQTTKWASRHSVNVIKDFDTEWVKHIRFDSYCSRPMNHYHDQPAYWMSPRGLIPLAWKQSNLRSTWQFAHVDTKRGDCGSVFANKYLQPTMVFSGGIRFGKPEYVGKGMERICLMWCTERQILLHGKNVAEVMEAVKALRNSRRKLEKASAEVPMTVIDTTVQKPRIPVGMTLKPTKNARKRAARKAREAEDLTKLFKTKALEPEDVRGEKKKVVKHVRFCIPKTRPRPIIQETQLDRQCKWIMEEPRRRNAEKVTGWSQTKRYTTRSRRSPLYRANRKVFVESCKVYRAEAAYIRNAEWVWQQCQAYAEQTLAIENILARRHRPLRQRENQEVNPSSITQVPQTITLNHEVHEDLLAFQCAEYFTEHYWEENADIDLTIELWRQGCFGDLSRMYYIQEIEKKEMWDNMHYSMKQQHISTRIQQKIFAFNDIEQRAKTLGKLRNQIKQEYKVTLRNERKQKRKLERVNASLKTQQTLDGAPARKSELGNTCSEKETLPPASTGSLKVGKCEPIAPAAHTRVPANKPFKFGWLKEYVFKKEELIFCSDRPLAPGQKPVERVDELINEIYKVVCFAEGQVNTPIDLKDTFRNHIFAAVRQLRTKIQNLNRLEQQQREQNVPRKKVETAPKESRPSTSKALVPENKKPAPTSKTPEKTKEEKDKELAERRAEMARAIEAADLEWETNISSKTESQRKEYLAQLKNKDGVPLKFVSEWKPRIEEFKYMAGLSESVTRLDNSHVISDILSGNDTETNCNRLDVLKHSREIAQQSATLKPSEYMRLYYRFHGKITRRLAIDAKQWALDTIDPVLYTGKTGVTVEQLAEDLEKQKEALVTQMKKEEEERAAIAAAKAKAKAERLATHEKMMAEQKRAAEARRRESSNNRGRQNRDKSYDNSRLPSNQRRSSSNSRVRGLSSDRTDTLRTQRNSRPPIKDTSLGAIPKYQQDLPSLSGAFTAKTYQVNDRVFMANEKLTVRHSTEAGPPKGEPDYIVPKTQTKMDKSFLAKGYVTFGPERQQYTVMGIANIDGWQYLALKQKNLSEEMVVKPGWSGVPVGNRPISAIDPVNKIIFVCGGTKVKDSSKPVPPPTWVADKEDEDEEDLAQMFGIFKPGNSEEEEEEEDLSATFGVFEPERKESTSRIPRSVPIFRNKAGERYIITHMIHENFMDSDVQFITPPSQPHFEKRRVWQDVEWHNIQTVLYHTVYDAFWVLFEHQDSRIQDDEELLERFSGKCGPCPLSNRPFTATRLRANGEGSLCIAINRNDLACCHNYRLEITCDRLTFCAPIDPKLLDEMFTEEAKSEESDDEDWESQIPLAYHNQLVYGTPLSPVDESDENLNTADDKSDGDDTESIGEKPLHGLEIDVYSGATGVEANGVLKMDLEVIEQVIKRVEWVRSIITHNGGITPQMRASFLQTVVTCIDWDSYIDGPIMAFNWNVIAQSFETDQRAWPDAILGTNFIKNGHDICGLYNETVKNWWSENKDHVNPLLPERFEDYTEDERMCASLIWMIMFGNANDLLFVCVNQWPSLSALFKEFDSEDEETPTPQLSYRSVQQAVNDIQDVIIPTAIEWPKLERAKAWFGKMDGLPGDQSAFESGFGYLQVSSGTSISWGILVHGALVTTYHGTKGRPLFHRVGAANYRHDVVQSDPEKDICVYGKLIEQNIFSACSSGEVCFVYDPMTDTKRYFKYLPVQLGPIGNSKAGGAKTRGCFVPITGEKDMTPRQGDIVRGHSGLPICKCEDGSLVGLVSSAFKASRAFTEEFKTYDFGLHENMIAMGAITKAPDSTIISFESDIRDISRLHSKENKSDIKTVVARLGSGKSSRLPFDTFKYLKEKKKTGEDTSVRILVLNPIRQSNYSLNDYITNQGWYEPGVFKMVLGGDELPMFNAGTDMVMYMTYGKYLASFERLQKTMFDVIFLDEIHTWVTDAQVFAVKKMFSICNAKCKVMMTATDHETCDILEEFPQGMTNFPVSVSTGKILMSTQKPDIDQTHILTIGGQKYTVPASKWADLVDGKGVCLVYVWSRAQCESLAQVMAKQMKHIKTHVCNAETDRVKFMDWLHKNDSHFRVVFCTDAIENGVTIPDVTGVIHLGKTMKPVYSDELTRGDGTKYEYGAAMNKITCLKTSMIQALGRTGRKNNGIFIHFMDSLGQYQTSKNYEAVVTNTEAEALPFMIKMSGGTDRDFVLRQCELLPELHLTRFYNSFRLSEWNDVWSHSDVPMFYTMHNTYTEAEFAYAIQSATKAQRVDQEIAYAKLPREKKSSRERSIYNVDHYADIRTQQCVDKSKNLRGADPLAETTSSELGTSTGLAVGIISGVVAAGLAFVVCETASYIDKHSQCLLEYVWYVKSWQDIQHHQCANFWDEKQYLDKSKSWLRRRLVGMEQKDMKKVYTYKAVEASANRAKYTVEALGRAVDYVTEDDISKEFGKVVYDGDTPVVVKPPSDEGKKWFSKSSDYIKEKLTIFWKKREHDNIADGKVKLVGDTGVSVNVDLIDCLLTVGKAVAAGSIENVPTVAWVVSALGPLGTMVLGGCWQHLCDAFSPAGAGIIMFALAGIVMGTQTIGSLAVMFGGTLLSYLALAGVKRDRLRGTAIRSPGVTMLISGGLALWMKHTANLLGAGNIIMGSGIAIMREDAIRSGSSTINNVINASTASSPVTKTFFGQLNSALNWLGFDGWQEQYLGQFSGAVGAGASVALNLLSLYEKKCSTGEEVAMMISTTLLDVLAGGVQAVIVGVVTFAFYVSILKLGKKNAFFQCQVLGTNNRNADIYNDLRRHVNERPTHEIINSIATIVCVAFNPMRLISGSLYVLVRWAMNDNAEFSFGHHAMVGASMSPLVAIVCLFSAAGKKLYNHVYNSDNGETPMSGGSWKETAEAWYHKIKHSVPTTAAALYETIAGVGMLLKNSGCTIWNWVKHRIHALGSWIFTKGSSYMAKKAEKSLSKDSLVESASCQSTYWIWLGVFALGSAVGVTLNTIIKWWCGETATVYIENEKYDGYMREFNAMPIDYTNDQGVFVCTTVQKESNRIGNYTLPNNDDCVFFDRMIRIMHKRRISNRDVTINLKRKGNQWNAYWGLENVAWWREDKLTHGTVEITYHIRTKTDYVMWALHKYIGTQNAISVMKKKLRSCTGRLVVQKSGWLNSSYLEDQPCGIFHHISGDTMVITANTKLMKDREHITVGEERLTLTSHASNYLIYGNRHSWPSMFIDKFPSDYCEWRNPSWPSGMLPFGFVDPSTGKLLGARLQPVARGDFEMVECERRNKAYMEGVLIPQIIEEKDRHYYDRRDVGSLTYNTLKTFNSTTKVWSLVVDMKFKINGTVFELAASCQGDATMAEPIGMLENSPSVILPTMTKSDLIEKEIVAALQEKVKADEFKLQVGGTQTHVLLDTKGGSVFYSESLRIKQSIRNGRSIMINAKDKVVTKVKKLCSDINEKVTKTEKISSDRITLLDSSEDEIFNVKDVAKELAETAKEVVGKETKEENEKWQEFLALFNKLSVGIDHYSEFVSRMDAHRALVSALPKKDVCDQTVWVTTRRGDTVYSSLLKQIVHTIQGLAISFKKPHVYFSILVKVKGLEVVLYNDGQLVRVLIDARTWEAAVLDEFDDVDEHKFINKVELIQIGVSEVSRGSDLDYVWYVDLHKTILFSRGLKTQITGQMVEVFVCNEVERLPVGQIQRTFWNRVQHVWESCDMGSLSDTNSPMSKIAEVIRHAVKESGQSRYYVEMNGYPLDDESVIRLLTTKFAILCKEEVSHAKLEVWLFKGIFECVFTLPSGRMYRLAVNPVSNWSVEHISTSTIVAGKFLDNIYRYYERNSRACQDGGELTVMINMPQSHTQPTLDQIRPTTSQDVVTHPLEDEVMKEIPLQSKTPVIDGELGCAGGLFTFGKQEKQEAVEAAERRTVFYEDASVAPWILHCRPVTRSGLQNVIWYDVSKSTQVDKSTVHVDDPLTIRKALLALDRQQFLANARAGTYQLPRKTTELSVGYFKMKQFLEDFHKLNYSRVWDSTAGSGGFLEAINEHVTGATLVGSTKRDVLPAFSIESFNNRGNALQSFSVPGTMDSITNKHFQDALKEAYPEKFTFAIWDAGESMNDPLKENFWLLRENRIEGLKFLTSMVAPGGSCMIKLKGLWYTTVFIEEICNGFGRACAWFCPSRRTNSQEWYLVLNRKKEVDGGPSRGYWTAFATSVQKALMKTLWEGFQMTTNGTPSLGVYEPLYPRKASTDSQKFEQVRGVIGVKGRAGYRGWEPAYWKTTVLKSHGQEQWDQIRQHPKMKGRVLPVGDPLKYQTKICSLKPNRKGGMDKVHYNKIIKRYATAATSWNIGSSVVGITSRQPSVIKQAIESRLDQPIHDIKVADLELLDRAFSYVLRDVPDDSLEPLGYDDMGKQVNNKGALGFLDDPKEGKNLGEYYKNPKIKEEVCDIVDSWAKGEVPLAYVTVMEKYEKKDRKCVEDGYLTDGKTSAAESINKDAVFKTKHWINRKDPNWREKNRELFEKEFFTPPRLIRYLDAKTRLAENMLYGNLNNLYQNHKLFRESYAGETWTSVGERIYREFEEMEELHGVGNVGILEGDFSKCDHHQNKQDCSVECHAFKKKFKKEWKKAVESNYSIKSEVVQIADFGVYTTNGQRLSGEKLTSAGNTAKVVSYLYACISRILGIIFQMISERFRIGASGDDWYLMGDKDSIRRLSQVLHKAMRAYGHVLRAGTQEGVIYHEDISQLSFCSHRYLKVGNFICPWRSLSVIIAKLTLTCKAAGYMEDHIDHNLVTASTAMSYLLMYPASMIVRHICLAVLAETGMPDGIFDAVAKKMMYKMGKWDHLTLIGAINSVWGVHELSEIPFFSPNIEGAELDVLSKNILYVSRRVGYQLRQNCTTNIVSVLLKRPHNKDILGLCTYLYRRYESITDKQKPPTGWLHEILG